MTDWSFLTNHARALVCIERDPGARLREIASVLDVTERRAFGIVNDLIEAGYVIKEKDGRRNQYRVQHDLPLRVRVPGEPTIGQVLALLSHTATPAETADGDGAQRTRSRGGPGRKSRSAKPA
jgi:hypothetical protein